MSFDFEFKYVNFAASDVIENVENLILASTSYFHQVIILHSILISLQQKYGLINDTL